ncbi:uncharacterized protein N7458_008089 [Penicillium daleae]|uniref:Yeast cell wall synthesis Kre9/Knh1-like N-terminal domain-containing protein n=1 Tax=Penicillium daleae TaxID=63821 RepID=A0AAD6C380_9EURO|nr:uncharacterized protein N7458_008089 [Penicillium daleae]KAJ5444217.1 hypothetical protein N7458_008089 [Penicillium daleae]
MRFSVAALVSAFAALAAAYTTPDYSNPPQGNAVRAPGLNEQVPEGKPYTIKWDHDLGKTVSIVLLRGPSTNVVPIATIAESIPNSGEFVWTPSASLTPDVTHYGLLIVVEDAGANHGAYQWSTQFGLSKAEGSTTTTTATTATTAITTPSGSHTTATSSSTSKLTITTVIDDVTTTYCPEDQSSSTAVSTVISSWEVTTTICPETTETPAPTASSSRVAVSPVSSSTLKSTPYIPAGTATATSTSTATALPTSTTAFNAAGRNVISFGAVVAGVAAFMAL